MRITNNMMMNNTMLGLNRNMQRLDKLYMQMTTLKRIQRPSDNPIIAGRALKFRTRIAETQQFQSNVEQANSWMTSTEEAIKNIESILGKMRDSCVQGANGTLGIEAQKTLADQMAELKKQFINEGNVTYDGGRYLLSGFRTDAKLIFDKDNEKNFRVTESFTKDHIEKFEIPGDNIQLDKIQDMINNPDALEDNSLPTTIYRIRLAYDDVSLDATILSDLESELGVDITTMQSTNTGAYSPSSGDVYFLEDTGELIFNAEDVENLPDDFAFDMEYDKNGFKPGDLNPIHYFECKDLDTSDDGAGTPYTSYSPTDERIQYEVGINNKIEVNTLGKDLLPADLMRDIDELVKRATDIFSAEKMINDQGKDLTEEQKKAITDLIRNSSTDISDSFDRLMGKIDGYLSKVSTERSSLGSRMKRLALVNNRLESDELNFKELNNNNEGIDLEEVYTEFSMQQVIYNSALNATSKIIQPTLLDFIR